MSPEETDKVCKLLFKAGGHAMNAKFVGRSPLHIASAAESTFRKTRQSSSDLRAVLATAIRFPLKS